MRAKDMMIPLREVLRPQQTVREAAELLRTARRSEEHIGVKALPVLNEKGVLVGILSIGDILKAVYPPYLYLMDLGGFTWDGMVEDFANKAAAKRVGDIMTTRIITVKEESTLMECVDHMLKNGVKRVPVLNGEHAVAGMLYERDVFYAIANAIANRSGKE